MSDLVTWAGEYLKMGFEVIALSGKTPNVTLHKNGLHSALSGEPETDEDWDFVRGFFEHPDTTGVGIVIPYPYVVVDIDGEEGAIQWEELLGGKWEIPPHWVARTGRGLHLWYASLQATGTIKLGSKLDLKGQGGYVAAPPSAHPDGGTYEWMLSPGAEAPLEAPEPLARRIAQHAFDLEGRMLTKQHRRVARKPRYQPGDTVFYAQLGYQALIDGMKEAEDGNRNNYLHWAAATMAEEGGIDEDFEELRQAALDIGLEPVEVKRTIRSARRGR